MRGDAQGYRQNKLKDHLRKTAKAKADLQRKATQPDKPVQYSHKG